MQYLGRLAVDTGRSSDCRVRYVRSLCFIVLHILTTANCKQDLVFYDIVFYNKLLKEI